MNDAPQRSGNTNAQDGPKILVIGSVNMDLVLRTATIPQPGQTVAGHSFATIPGGKGANQAVAAAKCGGRVSMIGRVGNDDFGQRLLLGLKGNGVDISPIMVSEGVNTGLAMITVDDKGENAICITGGANLKLNPKDIDDHTQLIADADAVLMQLEIPQETAVYALQLARHHHTPVILNPAPAPTQLNANLYEADVIILNQSETAALTCEPVTDQHSAKLAAVALLARGARAVVVTLGRRGAVTITPEQTTTIAAFEAAVVDTTGAGDAFCGALASCHGAGQDLEGAARFASAAAALACTKFGAQPSMPRRDAVERLLRRKC